MNDKHLQLDFNGVVKCTLTGLKLKYVYCLKKSNEY